MLPRTLALAMGTLAMLVFAAMADPALADDDPLDGARLFADVERYGSFGLHRYGSPGAHAAIDWIAEGLGGAGLAVSKQSFTLGRQYVHEQGELSVGGQRLDVVPQWWMPEDRASFELTAPIVATGEAPGKFVRLTLPFDRGAYLNDRHRQALAAAFERRPAAVLLTIEHPSGEIFTYNVDQASKPWPVPVILVAPKDSAALDAAQQAGTPVTVRIRGHYQQDVAGDNVVGRLDRGRGRWLVVSTPVTSWFTSTCERGPGIAAFLAVARRAAKTYDNLDLAFVATSGHEIGHGGMEVFLHAGAPPVTKTAAWVHFGSALACRDTVAKAILSSASFAPLIERHFAGIDGTRFTGEKAAVDEMRDVHAAGYPNFFGMAASHKFFHTPADSAAFTSPALLKPMVAAFAAALDEIAASSK
jgi:hypothetical protein